MTPILKIFYSLSQVMKNFAKAKELKISRGRKPKINDWEIASAFIISYLTHLRILIQIILKREKRLVVDRTILSVANVNRARTHTINGRNIL